jgi:ATP adenylyltransferase
VSLGRLGAAWRQHYIEDAAHKPVGDRSCVFCGLIGKGVSQDTGIVALEEDVCVILNAYPYGSGHLLVLPARHCGDVLSLGPEEQTALFRVTTKAIAAVEAAYHPDGVNFGANLGRAAGAGIPEHLHLHVLPRWNGDTNFITTIGETRVLPEALETTHAKVSAAWALL